MRFRLSAGTLGCAVLLAAGCGYHLGAATAPGGIRSIRVAGVHEDGIDLDAAALVATAVRRVVARGPSTVLEEDAADGVLRIELVDATAGLQPLANPGARAAQYLVRVAIRGELVDRSGRLMWTSPTIAGEAQFLSLPDGIEAIDGARRRALARAADDAAERLMSMMLYRP